LQQWWKRIGRRLGAIVNSSLPVSMPPNEPSLGYEANGISEFGDLVELANGPAVLLSATVGMSDWAPESDWSGDSGRTLGESTLTSAGFDIDPTLNLYGVNAGAPSPPMEAADIGGYIGEARFDAGPEPASVTLAGAGLLGLLPALRRAR
jgi:hypothetical protein